MFKGGWRNKEEIVTTRSVTSVIRYNILVYLPNNYHQQESCLRTVTLVHFPHQCLVHFPPPVDNRLHILLGYLEVQICCSSLLQNKWLSYLCISSAFWGEGDDLKVSKHAFFYGYPNLFTKNLVIFKTFFFISR